MTRLLTRSMGAAVAAVVLTAATAGAESDWLSLCGKCLSPSVTSKSGIGTSKAVAEGKITRKDAEGWCANWEPGGDQAACVRAQLASEDARKTYRATADCPGGRITAIDGQTYRLDGKWTSDVGEGRTRWRDASGQVVGQDHASNGLAISQQWEVMCPESVPAARSGNAGGPAPTNTPGAQYAVGQVVEAKYGRDWVRGRIDEVRQRAGSKGFEFEYDVRLDNGQRGIIPARMLRKPADG